MVDAPPVIEYSHPPRTLQLLTEVGVIVTEVPGFIAPETSIGQDPIDGEDPGAESV